MPQDTAAVLAAKRSVTDLAVEGLEQQQKTLPAKLFYDEEGCRLFRLITGLPEYYLTRTELAILADVAPRLARQLPRHSVLIEYGANDEMKANYLLRERDVFDCYVPIDMAASSLSQMQTRLAAAYPHLQVYPVVADFTAPISLPADVGQHARVGFFPGSTIGNLDPRDVTRFLQSARVTLGNAAQFLIGVDLRKDPSRLIPAYNDAAGVTAAFNLNLLARLNREAAADFDIAAFAHRAIWNDTDSRIEMHLVSRREQTVRVDGRPVHFASGEFIHTENSYKYAPAHFTALAAAAGWACAETCTDPDRLFALYLLRPSA